MVVDDLELALEADIWDNKSRIDLTIDADNCMAMSARQVSRDAGKETKQIVILTRK